MSAPPATTPDLRLLRYFLALGEELHFGRAAQRLHIAQPSLSRAIRELEQILGVQLLVRTKRSVRLTDPGRTLLELGPRAAAEVDRVFEETRRAGRGEVGELRLGFVPSAATQLVPAIVRAHRAAFPAVRLQLAEMLDEAQLEALGHRRLDVALLRTARPDSALRFEPLIREPMSLAMASEHRLARRRRIAYADLEGESLILWPRAAAPETFDAVVGALRAAGFSPRIVQEATSAYTILGLVAAGVGVSVLASSYAARKGEGVVFVPISGSQSTLYLARREDDVSPARDGLIAVARRVARGTHERGHRPSNARDRLAAHAAGADPASS
jgi:DNA-binding transcriptional LysR family regulator